MRFGLGIDQNVFELVFIFNLVRCFKLTTNDDTARTHDPIPPHTVMPWFFVLLSFSEQRPKRKK